MVLCIFFHICCLKENGYEYKVNFFKKGRRTISIVGNSKELDTMKSCLLKKMRIFAKLFSRICTWY